MNLDKFLKNMGLNIVEGYSAQVQDLKDQLIKLTSEPNIKVMEIGFNAGHSADTFLSNNPTMTLTSFDIGEHVYVLPAKQFIEYKFPGRHKLILGSSVKSVPLYAIENTGATFDVIFIDGCHEYSYAYADLIHCKRLSHKNTVVILDDTMTREEWLEDFNHGPNQAWAQCLQENEVTEIGRIDAEKGRGMTWGQYTF